MTKLFYNHYNNILYIIIMSLSPNWNVITSGASNKAITYPFNGTVKLDNQGNSYTINITDISSLYPINISNSDGSTFATFTPTIGNTSVLIKRNSLGMVLWYVYYTSNGLLGNGCTHFDIDTYGNVYIGGSAYGNAGINFYDTSNNIVTLSNTTIVSNVYFAKYNSNGILQFAFIPILPYLSGGGDANIVSMCCVGSYIYFIGWLSFNSSTKAYSIYSSSGLSTSTNTTTIPTVTGVLQFLGILHI